MIKDNAIPEPNTGCFLWLGAIDKWGYGLVSIGGKLVLAHRAAWIEHYGLIPGKLFVLHRCDTPCCVNETHLFLGTAKSNAEDAMRKGRFRWPQRRLTNVEIAAVIADPRKQKDIAAQYQITQAHVSNLKNGRSRKLFIPT